MRLFVRRDLDGFFGLFVDNLVQLLLIVTLCSFLCGMTGDDRHFLYGRILPGAAMSIVVGNLFYAWQAHRLARRTGRSDITALPYGINTPSLLVYVFFVMVPVYAETKSAEQAWRMGLVACLGSGVIEFCGAFVAEWVRKNTPRAALLSTLAGIAIGFISMTFALQIWSTPLIAMIPMAVVLITYFSGTRFPLGLPGGLVAIILGTILAWVLPSAWTGREMAAAQISAAWTQSGWAWPIWSGGALFDTLAHDLGGCAKYLSVIIPMGLFNVVGSLQNIESAEAAGDAFDTRASLATNGAGTILAALFGSCFPTTIYIGHPGWKGLGARAGYSTLNGLVITLMCLSGSVALVQSVVPIEAGIPIVLWIGIVITAQAFQATPREQAPAVALGLFPAIAAWGATVTYGAFMAAATPGAQGVATVQSLLEGDAHAAVSGFLVHGLIVLERGYIFTCMVIAAMAAFLIGRRFYTAACWALVGAVVTLIGLCHSYQLSGNSVDYFLAFSPAHEGAKTYQAFDIAIGYALIALVFAAVGFYTRGAEPDHPRMTH
ncbi:MAG TPA: NCS2 family permease [Phycisphaerae bacterium]|nr:NCS2 family permease [Phycisphaerae bacterium]HNU44884.1 NCS2 family permease [Phycisphaerae bacterium]